MLGEIEEVLVNELKFSRRLASLTRLRAARRAVLTIPGSSRHHVPGDPKDNPILQAAIFAGVDYLVTNDQHLLNLHPYEGIQIFSMTRFHKLLVDEGLLRLE